MQRAARATRPSDGESQNADGKTATRTLPSACSSSPSSPASKTLCVFRPTDHHDRVRAEGVVAVGLARTEPVVRLEPLPARIGQCASGSQLRSTRAAHANRSESVPQRQRQCHDGLHTTELGNRASLAQGNKTRDAANHERLRSDRRARWRAPQIRKEQTQTDIKTGRSASTNDTRQIGTCRAEEGEAVS